MSKFYYISKKADDLRMGDLFVDWAIQLQEFPNLERPAHRITSIKNRYDKRYDEFLEIKLDDGRKFNMHPGHKAIVRVLA